MKAICHVFMNLVNIFTFISRHLKISYLYSYIYIYIYIWHITYRDLILLIICLFSVMILLIMTIFKIIYFEYFSE